jgi:halocyanin-like protein
MDESSDLSRRALVRGVAGATAASTAAGTAAAQEGEGGGGSERPVWPSYVDGAKDGSYENLRGESSVTVEVGAGSDGLAFSPTKIWIDTGTEVVFEWVSDGHNVLPESQPEGAGWEGSGPALEDSGFTYSHTFETGGMYPYFCQPHESLGMKGAIAVGDDVETESVGGGGGTPVDPEHMGVPFHPHYVGVSTIVMMVVSLLFVFYVLKYGESPHTSGGND